ncbi:MAG: DNA/RNA non-specific endonuclease [Bacteroidales bacterium]|nr:DNA/RNA non-specific endonuclease [Bacteroidales bacterium]
MRIIIVVIFFFASCACLKTNDDYTKYEELEYDSLAAANAQIPEDAEPSPLSKSEGLDVVCRIECPEPSEDTRNNLIISKCDDTYGTNYFIEWDCEKRAQRWTAFQMYAGNAIKAVRRSGDDAWHEDENIPAKYRTTYADHYQNGYDRGHMIASADRLESREMNRQTFCYSNVHPQLNILNSGVWMDMEEKLRTWNKDAFRDTLYVVKGGTIDNEEQILEYTPAGILVPKFFYMAVLCIKDGKYKAMAFWIEHRNYYNDEARRLRNHVFTIDQLETYTGINFFCNLPDDIEEAVESEVTLSEWNM